jgi:hypothetical protein
MPVTRLSITLALTLAATATATADDGGIPPSEDARPEMPKEPPKAPLPPKPAPTPATAEEKPTATAVGAAFPEQLINRALPYGLRITLNGYFRAPLRISWRDRGDNRKEGEAQHDIRAPWLVDDDYFRSGFAYTRLQEQDWAEIYLGVGNKWLSGTIVLMGSLYSDWARPIIDRQFGIAQGYVTFNWEHLGERLRFKLSLKGGAFWDRFSYLPFYDTYLVGRTHQLGGQTYLEFGTRRFTVWLRQGVGAHLDSIEANQGFTLLNYVTAGLRYRQLVEGAFYFMDALTQDKRQLKELTDADMKVYGLDAKLSTQRFGRFFLGGSVIDCVNSTFLSPAIEVMHAYGGRGLTENYYGTERSENGTGRLYNLAFGHTYSVRDLLSVSGRERVHHLRGGDVSLSWFGVATYTLSKQADGDPLINRNGRTLFKWGVEGAWSALSWLALSVRYDRVILDTNDDANSFRILTPRITLRTHWLVDAEIYIQYSRYFYGERVHLRPGQIALETQPDTDVFKIQAQIVF